MQEPLAGCAVQPVAAAVRDLDPVVVACRFPGQIGAGMPPLGLDALRPLGVGDIVAEAAPAEPRRRMVGQERNRFDRLRPRQQAQGARQGARQDRGPESGALRPAIPWAVP